MIIWPITSAYITIYINRSWGASTGGSRGSVEPPKLNVKTYSKRVIKKKNEPTQLINMSFENDISLCLGTRKQQWKQDKFVPSWKWPLVRPLEL